jgi:hypothetical protein
MLATIEFDAKTNRGAVEIKRVRPDWMLASEMQAIQLVASKRAP